jgi:hypothetical protein
VGHHPEKTHMHSEVGTQGDRRRRARARVLPYGR